MLKGPEAFRTISEASEEIGVAQHVLRFWETRFPFIRPMKRAGGRRFYRPRDIATMKTLRHLLHEQGMSISDVQALYRSRPRLNAILAADTDQVSGADRPQSGFRLETALAGLERAKSRLDQLLSRR